MKRIIYAALILTAAAVTLSSCDKEEENNAATYFEFDQSEVSIAPGKKGYVDIEWARKAGTSATLELFVTTASLDNPAVKGTDYNISDETVTFSGNDKKMTIEIEALAGNDNEDKSFFIVMKSTTASNVGLGKPGDDSNKCLVTITKQ